MVLENLTCLLNIQRVVDRRRSDIVGADTIFLGGDFTSHMDDRNLDVKTAVPYVKTAVPYVKPMVKIFQMKGP